MDIITRTTARIERLASKPWLALRDGCISGAAKSVANDLDSNESLSWLCATFKPNAYRLADRNLTRQGYRVFCPMISETIRRGSRFLDTVSPLFPGYMFIGVPQTHAWRPIKATQGISRLVSFKIDGEPAELPSAFINDLMQQCDEFGNFREHTSIDVGSAVIVKNGPFLGYAGEVCSLKPSERIAFLMRMFGQNISVTISKPRLAINAS